MGAEKFGNKAAGWAATKGVEHAKPVAEHATSVPAGVVARRELERVPSLGERLRSGPSEGIELVDAQHVADGVRLAAEGELRWRGPMWTLVLDDGQTHRLLTALASGAKVALLAGAYGTIIAGVLRASKDYIETVDALGGHQGVEITGVLNNAGILVVPRGLPPVVNDLVDAGRLVVVGKTVLDAVIIAAAYNPAVAAALGIPIVGTVFSAVSAGTPLGWALAAGVGWVLDELTSEPRPEQFGGLLADRRDAGPWESFLIADLGGAQVAVLAHTGLFSADDGGGGGVHANRSAVGPWERWTLLRNGDGSVSLRSANGHYFTAERGGGAECNANRTAIGEWERFRLRMLPNGRQALQTVRKGTFVSAQP